MAVPIEEMWRDLDEADQNGDAELAQLIYSRIQAAESEEEEGPSLLERGASLFSPMKRSPFQDEEEAQAALDTGRGLAGNITSSTAGAVGGIVDAAAGVSDFLNPAIADTGSARETVRPFVEEMQDIQKLEADIGQQFRPEGGVGMVAYDAASAMGQMAPMIAAFMITKNPNVALGTMGAQVGGQTFSEKKAEGWSDLDAALEAGKQAAYEVGPERIFGVFQKMGGIHAVKDLLELAVAESGSEAVTELLNIAEESIKTSDDPMEFFNKLTAKSSADRVNYAALLGGILGVGMGGPGAVSTAAAKKQAMDVEEELRAGEYVRAQQAQRAVEADRTRTEADAKRQAAMDRAKEQVDKIVGRERERTDFEYEGTAGTVNLGGAAPVTPASIEGLESRFDAPQPAVVEEPVPDVPVDVLPTGELGYPGGRVEAEGQGEVELFGRERRPGELRDPQNVPPVGQAMVDEALDVEQYTPSELADFARSHLEEYGRDETPGLKQRAREEIDQLEQDATRGSGMWKKRAVEELKTLVRTQLDSRDLQGRVADRTRVMPVEDVVEVERETGTEVVRDEPGTAPQITDAGRKIAKRFQVIKDSGTGYFEPISFEPDSNIVHIRYNTTPAKKYASELDAGQELAYTDAWIDINDPNVVHIVGSVGTRKKVFPKRWRAEVAQRAREILTGLDVREGQRMKGRVTAKVPFVGAPNLSMHEKVLIGTRLAEAKQQRQGAALSKEEEMKVREKAKEEAKQTQAKALKALVDSQSDVEGGLVKLPSLPEHALDKGINIETRIAKGALLRVNKGIAQHERVFQVLPDGRLRTLEIVPQSKGKRYAVFALAEGVNKFVNPKTTSGRSIISEGIKIGEVGPVVKDETLAKIKEQGSGSLSDGLRIVRQRKRTAGDKQVEQLTEKQQLEEGKQAAEAIDYQTILNKEQAQRKARAEQRKQEKAEAKAEGVPFVAEQAGSAEGRGAEPTLEPDVDILDTETVSLEDIVEEEGAALAPAEKEEEARAELAQPETTPEDELTAEELEELTQFSRRAAELPSKLGRLMERTTNILGNTAAVRQRVMNAYSLNRAKVERAIKELEAHAEVDTTLSEKKGSGRSATGELDLRVYVDSGGQLTLRGQRQLSQVKSAINAIMAESPSLGSKTFPQLIEEAKLYLSTRPELPLSKQENLENEDLAELFLHAASAQKPKMPRSKKGWTEAEVSEQAEIAGLLVEEFGISPVEAVHRAQDILYGENLKQLAKRAKVGSYGRRYLYTEVGRVAAAISRAQAGKVPAQPAELGGRITEGAAQELLDRVQDGSLIRKVREQLIVSQAKGDRAAAEKAAIRDVLENMGFANLGPKLIAGIEANWREQGRQTTELRGLQAKIDRIEQALKEPDFLRTNFNAPVAAEPAPAPELSWAEEIKEKYESDPQFRRGRDPELYPEQLELDISTLMEMKEPTKGKVEETPLIQEGVSVAEAKLKAAQKKKPAKKKAGVPIKPRLVYQGALVSEPTTGLSPTLPAEQASSIYGLFAEAVDSAKLRWTASPVKLEEAGPEPATPEEAAVEQRTTSLEPDASLDAASAWDASQAVSYYASVEPLRNAKPGKEGVIATLRRIFTKEHGAPKGTRSLVDDAVGYVQREHEQAMDNWALAKAAMPGEWTAAKDAAVTHYLQDMSPEAVARKTGYTIPSPARTHLDRLRMNVAKLSAEGVRTGAFTRPSVVAAILGGRGYLSRSLGQTDKTLEQVNRMMPELAALFEEAHPSLTPEQIDEAKEHRLYNTIAYRLPNLQPNLTTASFDGALIGKKEGKQYLVQQLKTEGSTTPIPLAIVSETGNLSEIIATEEALRDIVKANIEEGVSPEQEVRKLVDAMLSETVRSGVSRGRGTDYGIQQTRRMLRSDSELVADAYRALWRANGAKKSTRQWLKDNVAGYRTGSIEDALDAAMDNVPEVAERITQLRSESKLNRKLREALNEITDPSTVVSKTVDSVAETIAMARFSSDLYRMLRAQNMANIGNSPEGTKWVRLMPEGTSLGDSNFVAVEAQQGGANGPGVRKVSDIYVPQEVAAAVRELTGYGRELETYHGAMKLMRQVSQFAKYGKVVLNPLAHPRNLVSTSFIHASRGMVGYNGAYATRVALGTGLDQAKLALGDRGRAWKAQKQTTEGKALEKLMLENNLLFDGGKSGALYDIRKQGFGARGAEADTYHFVNGAWVRSRNFADTLFRLEDEAVKGHALITYSSDYIALRGGNTDIVRKALSGKELTASEQKLFDKAIAVAAEQVKNTYPTFSRTPEIIKMLSRNPLVGAFPSFHAEMLRTTGHVIVDNANLMIGRLPDGTRVAEGQGAAAFVLGASRLSMTAALFSGAAIVANAMLRAALGGDEDDLDILELASYGTEWQRKARGLLPFWQRNSLTAVTDIDKENRTYTSVAVSYLSPFGQINDVLSAVVNKYKDANEAGIGSPEWEAFKAMGEGLIGTFGNTEPLFGSVYKRLRRNVSKYKSTNEVKNYANWVDGQLSDFFGGEYGNWAGALLGGTLEAASPELVAQGIALSKLGAKIMLNAPAEPEAQELATEVGNRMMSFGEVIGHVSGFKRRQQSFSEDFMIGIAIDKMAFSKANTDFKFALADPNGEGYYEDFKAANARRREAFNTLQDRFSAAELLLGIDGLDIMLEADAQGKAFNSSGDLDLYNFEVDEYYPPSPKDFWRFLKGSDRLNDMPEDDKLTAYDNYMDAYMRYLDEGGL